MFDTLVHLVGFTIEIILGCSALRTSKYRLCSRTGWSGRYFVLRVASETCIMRRFKICAPWKILLGWTYQGGWNGWSIWHACERTDMPADRLITGTHYAYGHKNCGTEWYEMKKRGGNFYGRIRSRGYGTLVLPMSNILFTSRTAIRLMELTCTLISRSA